MGITNGRTLARFARAIRSVGQRLQLLNRWLVTTLFRLAMAIVMYQHRNEGAWLSQLSSYLVPENAEVKRKRIQKLLYSPQADQRLDSE